MSTKTNAQVVELAFEAFKREWHERAPFEPLDKIDDYTHKPDLRSGNTAFEMLVNYVDQRRPFLENPKFRLIACEQPFAVPLTENIDGPVYVGRLDKVFEYENRIYVGEHKTTTAYKKDGPFTNAFVDSFTPNSQVDGYLYATHLLYGKKAKAVWVDAALVHKDVHDGFRFLPVERQFEQLAAWHWERLDWIRRIEANRDAREQFRAAGAQLEYMPAFGKNTNACTQYGNCPFMQLCKTQSNPEISIPDGEPPLGFVEEKWSPFDEVLMREGSNVPGALGALHEGSSMYDNTRISSFVTCPRAFYYRHVRDLRSEGTSRALIFGGAWHSAMDSVWSELGGRD